MSAAPHLWGWRHGDYLLTTDSPSTAETGVGYVTVAHCAHDLSTGTTLLTHVGTALGMADAVAIADFDRYHSRKEI